VHEDAFAERDAFGLTADDWASFLGHGPPHYSGPALVWWALAGRSAVKGPSSMSADPLSDLLSSIVADANALALLATASRDDDVRALAPAA
jgi:hypothetical protein